MRDFAIFEFSGLPKSGKSTTIEIVATYLRRIGYNVSLSYDHGTYAPIGKSDLGALNIYLAGKVVNSILELAYSKARTPTILLVDRGLFDRLTFSQTLVGREKIAFHEHTSFSNYLRMQRLMNLIDGVFVFTAPSDLILRREYSHAIHDTNGEVMNNDFLDDFRKSSLKLASDLSSDFSSIELVDTGNLDGLVRFTARKVAISIQKRLYDIGFHDEKVSLPKLDRYGDFLVSKGALDKITLPYYLRYEGEEYYRYMNALYAPSLPENLNSDQVVKLCELRNMYSGLTIDESFNRSLAKSVCDYISDHFNPSSEFSILDFGCGDGLSLQLMQDEGLKGDFVGCDLSRNSVETATKRGFKAFHFVSGDKWDLHGKRFDCATAFFVMHFDIPIADIRELRKHVKHGAPFIFNIYNGTVHTVEDKLVKCGWSSPVSVEARQLGRGHQLYMSRAI